MNSISNFDKCYSWSISEIQNYYDMHPNLELQTFAAMLGLSVSKLKRILMSC